MTEPIECPHDRVVLVEGGYERWWEWSENPPGREYSHRAMFSGLEDFSDEGDGEYELRCRTCLADLTDQLPEEWEWD